MHKSKSVTCFLIKDTNRCLNKNQETVSNIQQNKLANILEKEDNVSTIKPYKLTPEYTNKTCLKY